MIYCISLFFLAVIVFLIAAFFRKLSDWDGNLNRVKLWGDMTYYCFIGSGVILAISATVALVGFIMELIRL